MIKEFASNSLALGVSEVNWIAIDLRSLVLFFIVGGGLMRATLESKAMRDVRETERSESRSSQYHNSGSEQQASGDALSNQKLFPLVASVAPDSRRPSFLETDPQNRHLFHR
jgi:hypothetical protein